MNQNKSVITKGDQLLFYASNRQHMLLWFVTVICLSCAVVVTLLTLSMTTVELKRDFSSLIYARLWQLFMLILGNILFVVMLWMSGRYVLKIERLQGGSLRIIVWHILLWKQVKIFSKELWQQQATYHEGKANYSGLPSVNAPWIGIKPIGYRKMIVDMQGEFPFDVEALLTVVQPQ